MNLEHAVVKVVVEVVELWTSVFQDAFRRGFYRWKGTQLRLVCVWRRRQTVQSASSSIYRKSKLNKRCIRISWVFTLIQRHSDAICWLMSSSWILLLPLARVNAISGCHLHLLLEAVRILNPWCTTVQLVYRLCFYFVFALVDLQCAKLFGHSCLRVHLPLTHEALKFFALLLVNLILRVLCR